MTLTANLKSHMEAAYCVRACLDVRARVYIDQKFSLTHSCKRTLTFTFLWGIGFIKTCRGEADVLIIACVRACTVNINTYGEMQSSYC